MKHFGIAVLGIVGALAFTATSASAAIICNEDGDCWHVKEKYEYKPEFGLHVYGDDWKFTDNKKYRWREHEGAATGVLTVFGSNSKNRPLRKLAGSLNTPGQCASQQGAQEHPILSRVKRGRWSQNVTAGIGINLLKGSCSTDSKPSSSGVEPIGFWRFAPSIVQSARSTVSVQRLALLPD